MGAHEFADIPCSRPFQLRAVLVPVVRMEGHAKGAGVAYTAVAAADTGYFFSRFSQHVRFPIPFMAIRRRI